MLAKNILCVKIILNKIENMKKFIAFIVVCFSFNQVNAQKDKIYYHLQGGKLYVQETPFTGNLYTFCRLEGNCPPDVKDKKIILFTNLGEKKNRKQEIKHLSFFIQNEKTKEWHLVLVLTGKNAQDYATPKNVLYQEEKKSLVIDGKEFLVNFEN